MKESGKIGTPLRPLTVLVTTGLLFILFIGFAYFEYLQSRNDIFSVMKEEGFLLLNTLLATGERSILAYEEIELQTQTRIFQAARTVQMLDKRGLLSKPVANDLIERMDLAGVYLYNMLQQEDMVFVPAGSERHSFLTNDTDRALLLPVLRGDIDSLLIGFRVGTGLSTPAYGVALHRFGGGAVLVLTGSEELNAIRQAYGPGRLVQEIGIQKGVSYVVLQDTFGIRLASRGITSMNRIKKDAFLENLYSGKSRGWRIIRYHNEDVFEIAGAFFIEGSHLGLFRIGLDMQYYRHVRTSALIRMLLIMLIFVFLGIVGFSFFLASQNVRFLSRAYQRVQTHTGIILQNLEDAVIAVNQAGIITEVNRTAEWLCGKNRKALCEKSIYKLDLPCSGIIRETLETAEPRSVLNHRISLLKRERIVAMRTSLVRDDRGDIEAVILIMNDITKQNELENRIRQQEKFTAIGELASGVAHEIRNPINAIGLVAQRLIREFRPEQDQEEYLELAQSVKTEVARINGIIQQFLKFAKPPRIQCQRISMTSFFKDLKLLFTGSMEKGDLNVVFEIEEATVSADRDLLKQVLFNLYNNAVDAVKGKGTITISGTVENKYYIIRVADNGEGIPENDLNRIFDLYFTTKTHGTGMGLAIAHQIISNHGGNIDVESQRGKGSTFTIHLPLGEQS